MSTLTYIVPTLNDVILKTTQTDMGKPCYTLYDARIENYEEENKGLIVSIQNTILIDYLKKEHKVITEKTLYLAYYVGLFSQGIISYSYALSLKIEREENKSLPFFSCEETTLSTFIKEVESHIEDKQFKELKRRLSSFLSQQRYREVNSDARA